ncbi:hypothetical protein [Sessilibacter corallicola]|uniref:hypothetical protein n=1 Tax=Sessilibacter corallicola TaxID=2904075 RepID=UPI001E2C6196|nr:hypothetical protein [Sessilibacter corallicola]MCE2027416.1 hypothetical protein [Sessilibacter corallicola]
MTELTFKDISYIRSALQYRLAGLEREIISDNKNSLEKPLSEDERIEIQEDIIFYDKLLYQFEQAEKQSQVMKITPSIVLP